VRDQLRHEVERRLDVVRFGRIEEVTGVLAGAAHALDAVRERSLDELGLLGSGSLGVGPLGIDQRLERVHEGAGVCREQRALRGLRMVELLA
jgi:hypothetical protein